MRVEKMTVGSRELNGLSPWLSFQYDPKGVALESIMDECTPFLVGGEGRH